MKYYLADIRRKYRYGEVSTTVRGGRHWPIDDKRDGPWVTGEFSEDELNKWNADPSFEVGKIHKAIKPKNADARVTWHDSVPGDEDALASKLKAVGGGSSDDDSDDDDSEDLSKLTKAALIARANELGIDLEEGLNKAQIVEAIQNHDLSDTDEE